MWRAKASEHTLRQGRVSSQRELLGQADREHERLDGQADSEARLPGPGRQEIRALLILGPDLRWIKKPVGGSPGDDGYVDQRDGEDQMGEGIEPPGLSALGSRNLSIMRQKYGSVSKQMSARPKSLPTTGMSSPELVKV